MTFFGWFYIEKQKTSKLIQGELKVKSKHPKIAVLPLHKKPLYEASHKAYSDLHPLDNAHAERTKKAEIFRRLPLCY